MNSTKCKQCNGCKHQIKYKGWCYMFKNKPDIIPCGQHDKYDLNRKVISKILKEHPEYLQGLTFINHFTIN